ncbi:MAG: YkgJ family cysteine cluster protein [bacterium]
MSESPSPCDGCTFCASRCTDGIMISELEFTRIVEVLRELPLREVHRVLEQSKKRVWFEEITYTACLFLDNETDRCLIYSVRPLICRLFGRVKHLPCPINKCPADIDAREILKSYTELPLHTFQQWMCLHHMFNFEDLLGIKVKPPCIEI